MNFKVILTIALKNLMRKKSRAFVTIFALSVAIGLVVILVSLGFGLQEMVINNFTTLESMRTIDVTPEKSQQIVLNDEAIQSFKDLDSVDTALPIVELGARIKYGNSVTDIALVGLDKDTFSKWVSLNVSEPDKLENFYDKKAVLTQSTATLLGVEDVSTMNGQSIELQISLDSFLSIEDTEPLVDQFEVLTGEKNSTSPIVFVPIEYLQQNGLNRYSVAKVVTKSADDVPSTRLLLEKMGYKTTTSQDTVDQIIEIFRIIRIGLSTFGIVAGVVAALGMFNTLTVSLMEKTREIGILKALGAQKSTILKLFMAESMIISFWGSVMGILMGILISAGVQLLMSTLAKMKGYSLAKLFNFPFEFMLIVFAFALVVGFLTGFYPAMKAARVNTLDALRYE